MASGGATGLATGEAIGSGVGVGSGGASTGAWKMSGAGVGVGGNEDEIASSERRASSHSATRFCVIRVIWVICVIRWTYPMRCAQPG